MAAGVLLAAAWAAAVGVAVLTAAALRLVLSGDARLTFGGAATALLAVGYGAAYAAALAAPTRLWTPLRPATLVLAFVVSVAWPLSGFPLVAAVLATLAVGLKLARDRRCPPAGHRVRGGTPAALLAVLATGLVITGLALAGTHPVEPPAASSEIAAPKLDLGVHGSPFATAAPVPTPKPSTPSKGAATFVRDYYDALDARRFEAAWAVLSPAVRRSFGGFDRWSAGYAGTISSRPQDIVVTRADGTVSVRHVLIADHRDCNGEQRFSVTWNLERASRSWRVTGLQGTALNTPPCA